MTSPAPRHEALRRIREEIHCNEPVPHMTCVPLPAYRKATMRLRSSVMTYRGLAKKELIAELDRLLAENRDMSGRADEHERLLHNLHVHQIELDQRAGGSPPIRSILEGRAKQRERPGALHCQGHRGGARGADLGGDHARCRKHLLLHAAGSRSCSIFLWGRGVIPA
jgi:hypothetical protein